MRPLLIININLDIPEFLQKDWYIFSGILGTQLEVFRQRLMETPLQEVETFHENMWFSVLARGKATAPQ